MASSGKRVAAGGGDKQAVKKQKQTPFEVSPSSLTMSQMQIKEPFLKWMPMEKRDIQFNKFVGGKCDFEALDWLLKQWVLPALDVVCDTFGYDKSREMQTRLSNTIVPCLITMLAKQEEEDSKSKLLENVEGLSLLDTEETLSGKQLAALLRRGLQKMDAGLAAARPLSEEVQKLLLKRGQMAEDLLKLLELIDREVLSGCRSGTGDGNCPLRANLSEEGMEDVTFRVNEGLPGDVEEEGSSKEVLEEGEDVKGTELQDQSAEAMEEDAKPVAGVMSADEVSTPQDAAPTVASEKAEGSPDSSYGASHRHEDDSQKLLPPKSTMDVATYVKDKTLDKVFLKNVKECKGDDTIGEWLSGKGNANQVALYSAEYAKFNLMNGRFGSIYGQGYNVKKWVGAENVPKAVVTIGPDGKLGPGAVENANEQIKQGWGKLNPGKDFDKEGNKALLTSTKELEEVISKVEKKLQTEYGLPVQKAKIPEGIYELGEFYHMMRPHDFLTLPLEAVPPLSAYAYLEAELLIALGVRVTKWSKKDFQTRILNDLKRRMADQAQILELADSRAMKAAWKKHHEATTYKDLVVKLL